MASLEKLYVNYTDILGFTLNERASFDSTPPRCVQCNLYGALIPNDAGQYYANAVSLVEEPGTYEQHNYDPTRFEKSGVVSVLKGEIKFKWHYGAMDSSSLPFLKVRVFTMKEDFSERNLLYRGMFPVSAVSNDWKIDIPAISHIPVFEGDCLMLDFSIVATIPTGTYWDVCSTFVTVFDDDA